MSTTAPTKPLFYPHRGGALVAEDTRGFEEGRQYQWGTLWLDSVTSIISAGVPKGERFNEWIGRECGQYAVGNLDALAAMPFDEAERLIANAPFKKRDDAAELGSSVHDYAEAVVLDLPLPELSEAGMAKAGLFRRWLDEYKPDFECAEAWVYNLGRRYAGRLDAIANIPGIGPTLIDYKTGKRAHAEVGLQLAALRNAEFVGLPDGSEVAMPQVKACAVLHIQKEQYRFNLVRADDVEFRTFLYAQQVLEWRKDAIHVIGASVPMPSVSKYPPRPSAPVDPAAYLD